VHSYHGQLRGLRTDENLFIAWGSWNRNNPDIKNVQYLMSCSITNEITLEFIKLILGTD
jgi:hypothetical protein